MFSVVAIAKLNKKHKSTKFEKIHRSGVAPGS